MALILSPQVDSIERFQTEGGGKAANLARLTQLGLRVPPFFCISAEALQAFIEMHQLSSRIDAAGVDSSELQEFEKKVEQLFIALPLPEALAGALRETQPVRMERRLACGQI
jgi:pyruvate,water dikinase